MQVAIAEQMRLQQAALRRYGRHDGAIAPRQQVERYDAIEDGVDFAEEGDRLGLEGARFARLVAAAKGVAVAEGCSRLRSSSFRLRPLGFGGQVGGPFGNIIVRKISMGGPPWPLARDARPRRRDHGGVYGEGVGVRHGAQMGQGAARFKGENLCCIAAIQQLSRGAAGRRVEIPAPSVAWRGTGGG